MARKKYIQLEIPNPCHQQWSEMRPDGKGRFCDNCQQTVIDFTQMSDGEIARIMSLPQAPHCGRYLASQVNRPILLEPVRSGYAWPRLAAGVALFVMALPHALLSQTGSKIDQIVKPVTETPLSTQPVPVIPAPQRDMIAGSAFTLSGNVINSLTGAPYEEAKVSIYSIAKSSKTDSLGFFSLEIDLDQLPDSFLLDIVLPDFYGDKQIPLQKSDLPSFMTIAVEMQPVIIMGRKESRSFQDIPLSTNVISKNKKNR